jgi:hypothetical protein
VQAVEGWTPRARLEGRRLAATSTLTYHFNILPLLTTSSKQLGVRTRGDLASLINAGSDSIIIKTEISDQVEESTEPMEDDDNEVVCVVNLDESNRIIHMDDPFGTDDNYVYEGSDTDRDGEELLEESGGGDTGSEEEEHEEQGGGLVLTL